MKNWLQTYQGTAFCPTDPNPDFNACDIRSQVRAMSMLCRYGGHVNRFYSVAEHAVRVSRRVESRMLELEGVGADARAHYCAKWGLIHDNAEGCGLVDIPSPVKAMLPGYVHCEKALQKRLAVWLGLEPEEPAIVRAVDTEILGTETSQLMAPRCPGWPELAPEFPGAVLGWSSADAERIYLTRFKRLFGPDCRKWGLL